MSQYGLNKLPTGRKATAKYGDNRSMLYNCFCTAKHQPIQTARQETRQISVSIDLLFEENTSGIGLTGALGEIMDKSLIISVWRCSRPFGRGELLYLYFMSVTLYATSPYPLSLPFSLSPSLYSLCRSLPPLSPTLSMFSSVYLSAFLLSTGEPMRR